MEKLKRDIGSIVWRYLFDDVLVELRKLTRSLYEYHEKYIFIHYKFKSITRCKYCKDVWVYIVGHIYNEKYLRSDCVKCGSYISLM